MQEDIHITSRDGIKGPGDHALDTLLDGAALTAHNLAKFLGLPHMPLHQPAINLHRDSCATGVNDESWQAAGQHTPRWLAGSPRSTSRATSESGDSGSEPDGDDAAGGGMGGVSADGVAAPCSSSNSTERSEVVLQSHAHACSGPASNPMAGVPAPAESPSSLNAAVAAEAAPAANAGAARPGVSLKRNSTGSMGGSGRVALTPVHTTLFRPSAGATTMPVIVEAASAHTLPPAELPGADKAAAALPQASTSEGEAAARGRLNRKSKQALQGGQIKYHDGRPKLGGLFDAVEMQAKAAGCERVAVLICGNKHLLHNCLKLVKERERGEVAFEAHYESFGFV